MVNLTLSQLEKCSIGIYSSDKALRKQSRAQLIQQTVSFENIDPMTEKQQKDYPSWYSLSYHVNRMIQEEKFPFAINQKKAGEIYKKVLFLRREPISHRDFENSNQPCYVVNMPHLPRLEHPRPIELLAHQIDLLWREGFGLTEENSRAEADKRLAVVVGINYCNDLDVEKNKRYKEYIRTARTDDRVAGTHVKVSNFSWRPVWHQEGKEVTHQTAKRLYRLLSEANPELAQRIRQKVMLPKGEVVPYQRIRDEIKNHPHTLSYYQQMRHGFSNRPAFLVSWDDDAVKLRTEDNKGIFSHYDDLIAQHPNLEVATTGYYMVNERMQFVELASRSDLVGRRAIAYTLPNGAYFPEPNIIIKIRNNEDLKHRISFLRKGAAKGKGLEYLGLIENLNLKKGDMRGRMVFGNKGPIQTSQPLYANVPRHIPNTLNPRRINNEKCLASLRRFSMSVLNPKKGFADSVARAMPQGTGSAVNTAFISKMYTAFDSIDYIKRFPFWKDVWRDFANCLIDIYNKKQERPALRVSYDTRAKRIAGRAGLGDAEKKMIAEYLESKFTDLWSARTLVVTRVVSEEQFKVLLYTAINTNHAIYRYLTASIDQTPFVFPSMMQIT